MSGERVWRNWQTRQVKDLVGNRGGSSPSTRTTFFIRPHGQEVKTPPSHGGNPGSIPGAATNMRIWRNWQTRTVQVRVRKLMGVRIPLSAPNGNHAGFHFFC